MNSAQEDALILGLDCGTSLIKAGVYTLAGDCVGFGSAHALTSRDGPNRVTMHPEKTWEAALWAVSQAVSSCPDARKICGVSCCSVGEAAVLISSSDKAISPIYAWVDRRGEETCSLWKEQFGEEFFAHSGQPLEPILTAFKLEWVRQHDASVYRGADTWLTLADYILLRLCGRRSAECSLACRSGVFDIRSGDWNYDFLEKVGLRSEIFTPLSESGTALGEILPDVAYATGLPRNCVCAVGGYDQALGALVVGGLRDDTLSVAMGSTEAQVIAVDGPQTDPKLCDAGICQGVLGFDNGLHRFLLGGIYTAGLALEWLRHTVLCESRHSEIIDAAEAVAPGSDGVRFLPQMLVGSDINAQVRPNGAFWGLGLSCDRGTLYRAILEGLAFEGRMCTETLALALARGGSFPKRIRAVGGDTRNHLRLKIKASVAHLPIEAIGLRSAPSLGAAIMAARAAGLIANIDEALTLLNLPVRIVDQDAELSRIYDPIYETSYSQASELLTKLTQIP